MARDGATTRGSARDHVSLGVGEFDGQFARTLFKDALLSHYTRSNPKEPGHRSVMFTSPGGGQLDQATGDLALVTFTGVEHNFQRSPQKNRIALERRGGQAQVGGIYCAILQGAAVLGQVR